MSLYGELRREFTGKFAAAGIETAALDAELLISGLAGFPRSELFFRTNDEVPVEQENRLRALAARREAREPLQYVLGSACFMDLELEVTPAVLIPRPETELLVEWAVKHLPPGGKLLDLGTGSGAIALAVAAERPDAAVSGVDVSPDALAVARRNRTRYGFDHVEFLESDLFAALTGRKFDLIAANLPYVTFREYHSLEPEVRCFEPQLALTADDEGFSLIARAATALPAMLLPGGRAIFELSPHQAGRLTRLLEAKCRMRSTILRDYTGRDRFVTAEFIP